ncbi:M24 family metallopeptidase [Leucobacter sp. wl10]|uniref:M24 family metallopeptidase n=1 Tax=Leucobacter sp. wl10 TaxID=2304677 RepID=UPI000E5AA50B|nr:M24 family metallopeptidase [Leucobacter sp. wl10]RGE23297.1 M24 family metallopeptidase [Leucobacter sp. wl10]
MAKIICDPRIVAERYGFVPNERLLFSAIRLDSFPFVTPLVFEDEGEEILLARQQEQGNIITGGGVDPAKIRFYEPWVTIDPRPVADYPAAANLPALVKELVGERPVDLDPRAPYAHYLKLTGEVDVRVELAEERPVHVFEVDQASVLSRFAGWRAAAVPVAERLIAEVDHLAGLERELAVEADTRFSALPELAEGLGADAILFSSAPNYSEATGTVWQPGALALWAGGSLYVIAERRLRGIAGAPRGAYGSAAQAITALAGGPRIAFEEQWEQSALGIRLTDAGAMLVSASRALGSWRDERDREDLPFQLIAARASTTAIEQAVAWAHERLDAGDAFTENALYERYLEFLDRFRHDAGIPFGIEPYFTNLHSSQRMLFPGPPTDFPIDASTTCVQLDAGVKVVVDGVVVATSDMARSVLRTPEGREAYGILMTAVREAIIPQLRPGVVCEDVHAKTLEHLATVRPRMREIGLLGDEVDFDVEYSKRNVGHLMGKQESFANELRPGYRFVLREGSYGAAEIPWRYDRHAIGTEDLWYIGADRTYNLTLREQ